MNGRDNYHGPVIYKYFRTVSGCRIRVGRSVSIRFGSAGNPEMSIFAVGVDSRAAAATTTGRIGLLTGGLVIFSGELCVCFFI